MSEHSRYRKELVQVLPMYVHMYCRGNDRRATMDGAGRENLWAWLGGEQGAVRL